MSYFSKTIHDTAKALEKRQTRRTEASEDILVEFKRGRFAKKICIGYGQDISLGGIRFFTLTKPRKGEKLDLSLYFSPKFPGPRRIKLRAVVTRVYGSSQSGQYQVGCRLLGEEFPESREAIRQFAWWFDLNVPSRNSEERTGSLV